MSLSKGHSISAHKDEVGQIMHRWKHHDPRPLHSGKGKKGKEGKVVKSREQAIAIALSMAGKSDHAERLISMGYSEAVAEEVVSMLEDAYDFTRCQRPDGSIYGTGGKCRKGEEKSIEEILKGGVKGRVPKDDPQELLGSGSTPLEKAKEKLKQLTTKLSNTDIAPSEKELERYGRLKLAVDEFINRRDGVKSGLFQREDRSDIDESKSRKAGKTLRKAIPSQEDRMSVVQARELAKQDFKNNPLLRKKNHTIGEILKLEGDLKQIREKRSTLQTLVKRLSRARDYDSREIGERLSRLDNLLSKVEESHVKALKRSGGDYSEPWDFVRCQRPNGTHYGKRGKCRQGSETKPEEKTKTAKKPRLSKSEKIVTEVMSDRKFNSDRKRVAEMIRRGIPKNFDFVSLVASVREKLGGEPTDTIRSLTKGKK